MAEEEDSDGDFEDEVDADDIAEDNEAVEKKVESKSDTVVTKEVPKPKEEVKLAPPRKGAPLSVTMVDVKEFLDCITAISDLIAEISISVTPSGIIMRAMDPANVAMVNCVIKPAAFVEYNVPESGEFGVKLTEMKAILRRMGKDSACKIRFDDKIRIEGVGKIKKFFTMPIIELDDKKMTKLPEMSFTNELKLDTATLKDSLEDMELIGESCHFVVKDNKFSMCAKGDLNEANVDIGEAQVLKGTPSESRYSIEYLKKMMTKLSSKVTVKFGKDYPCQIEYKEDKIEMIFLLAPRVEND